MLCYRDKTFCASPNCKNECGRKLLEPVMMDGTYISYAYFCGEPEEEYSDEQE